MTDETVTPDKQMDVQRHGTLYLLSSAGITLIGFLATMFYAHWVGQDVLGLYFLFLSCFNIICLFTDFGIGLAGVQRMCEGWEPDQYFTASLVMRMGLFSIISLILVILQYSFILPNSFSELNKTGLFWLLILTIGIATFQSSISMAMGPRNRLGLAATISFLDNGIRIIVQVVSVFLGFQVYGLIGGLITGLLVEIIVYLRYIDYHLKKFDISHVKKIFSFSTWTFLSSICTVLFDNLNPLIIAMFLPVSDVGIFGVCWTFSVFALFVSSALCNTLFVKVSRWYSQGETTAITVALSRATTYSMIFAIPLLAGGIIFGKDLLYFCYGASFVAGAAVLVILIGARLIQSVLQIYTYFLLATDQAKTAFYSALIGMVTNIILSLILVPVLGITGVAIGTLVNVIISVGISWYYIRRVIRVTFERVQIIHIVEATGIMVLAIELILLVHTADSAFLTGLQVLAGALIYGCVLLAIDEQIRSDALRTLEIKWFQA